MVSPREIAGMIGGAVVAIDFDGTLANITPHPEDSRLIDGALDALRALAAAGATVAIVTGRTAASALEAGELARVPGLVIEGLYGAERWHNDEFNSLPVPAAFAHLQAELPDLIRRITDDPSVWIEDKRISLVVHARVADDPAMVLSKLYAPLVELASTVGMEVHGGKDVLEVRLPGVNKAGAIQRLITDTTSAVVFAGDDVGDIPAFSAVHAWRRQTGRPALTIGVVAHPGAPVAGIADLEVSDPTAVVRLLAQLLP